MTTETGILNKGFNELETSGSPLRRMWATLDHVEEVPNEQYGPSAILYLVFDDPRIDIIESTVVYEFETHELKIKLSPKQRSTWGFLIESIDKLGVPNIQELCGKRVLFVWENYEWGAAEEGKEAITSPVWRIMEIEGPATSSDVQETLLELAHGKERGTFTQAAMASAAGKAVQDKLFSGVLLSEWVAQELVEIEDGVIWVKGMERPSS